MGSPLTFLPRDHLFPQEPDSHNRGATRLDFAVVIPARDAAPNLALCMPEIRSQMEEHACELIVVDDGSIDDTTTVATAWGARVVAVPGLGPAAARNAGAAATQAPVILFFDADCVPGRGCIQALLEPFANPAVTAVRGGYVTSQRSPVARFVQLEMEEKQERMRGTKAAAFIDTACAAFRRERFFAYGGFDESYKQPSVEDVDLSFRMAAGGEMLVYAPGARVAHHHCAAVADYARRKYRFGFNRAKVYRSHPERLRGDGYTPRLMPLQILLAPFAFAAGAVSLIVPAIRPLAVGSTLGFLAATAPLTVRALRGDRGIALLVPVMLAVRSISQAAGLAAGLAALLSNRIGAALNSGARSDERR